MFSFKIILKKRKSQIKTLRLRSFTYFSDPLHVIISRQAKSHSNLGLYTKHYSYRGRKTKNTHMYCNFPKIFRNSEIKIAEKIAESSYEHT